MQNIEFERTKMATAQHLKALIKSHFDNESERFITLALQIAAHEAKHGHINVADDIRKIVDKSKTSIRQIKPFDSDLQGLILEIETTERLSDLIVSKHLKDRISRILKEYHQKEKLKKHGLENRRKILLSGPPGTGKTMTASIISREVHLPLYIILMDKLVTKFMGETSAKLRQIFDVIQNRRGVYLFDEFDAIGGERDRDNDVGEMRRVLNAFLQFIERDKSDSIIVAATNNQGLLDQALFRRFDDVLKYQLPTKIEATLLIENRLANYRGNFKIGEITNHLDKLSHAELSLAILDAIKEAILNNKEHVDKDILIGMIEDRIQAYNSK